MDTIASLESRLSRLYGAERATSLLDALLRLVDHHPAHASRPPLSSTLSECDVLLIAYGDHLRRSGEAHLRTLHHVLRETVGGVVNSLHLLPFYPYSSDDGFSVIDYYAVDPALGSWDDINAMRADFRLMFDAVFNHMSAQSAWFQAFLRGEPPYDAYFATADPAADLSAVVRPRTHPLLTRFETARGPQHVWTTFSADQVDLNFANPDVLLEMARVLLFYVAQGATFIRLDAIAFLWKTVGTPCIHLEETHLIVQVLRDLLDLAAPGTILITETNVPHDENIRYFGNGRNEAQLVYQFPLPPLTLHTLHTGDASALTAWAASLATPGSETTFFNFLASHDGIGMRPVTGILSDAERDALVRLAEDHGGFVSYRSLPDGSKSPYELNISYFDAITHPAITAVQPVLAVQRFLVAQAIMLALAGVPGIYLHSLFGSRNWRAGVEQTGHNRAINREKLDAAELRTALDTPGSLRQQVFTGYMRLLRQRTTQPAFHPLAAQRVLTLHPALFAVERGEGVGRILALHNVSGQPVTMTTPDTGSWRDLLGATPPQPGGHPLTLAPYQIAWLRAEH